MKAKNKQSNLESNLWKYAIYLVTKKRSYITILGVYLLTLPDATAQTLGLMNLIGNFTGVIFEVPSGYLADKLGHKNALVFASFCLLVSSVLFLVGSYVWIFIVAAAFMNVAFAFHSGTGTAFMHETLKGLGRESEYSKVMGRLSSIGFGVPIILITAIPFLVGISFKAAFVAAVLIDIVGLVVAFSLVAPQKTKEQIAEIDLYNFKMVVRDGHRLGYLKYALFLAVISGGIISSSYFRDVYQAALGVPIIYFGIFWATSRALISGLLLLNDKVKRWLTFHQFLFLKMVIGIGLLSLLGIFASPWFIVPTFILLAAFNWSFQEVQKHYILEIIGQSNFKSTLLSMGALMSISTSGLLGFGIGYLADRAGYARAFQSAALVLGVILISSYLYILFSTKVKKASVAV